MPDSSYTYLLIDLLCIIIPLAASFHPRSPFYKEWKYYLPVNLVVSLFFLVWDWLFTHFHIWGFNDDYITGIRLFGLPIEEVLFFICIPYACTYTYYVFNRYTQVTFPATAIRISYLLASLLFIATILNPVKLYTSVTFMLLAILLATLSIKRTRYLDSFFIVYLMMLIPFFVSNGILTGFGVDSPIVWYNDQFNLGIRMLTIPVEDAFYAMLMLLMNIAGYEWLKKKKSISPSL